MERIRTRSRGLRLLARLAGIMVLSVLLLFVGLELTLSGPFGMSGYVVFRALRTFARDATIPTPPSLAEFSNTGPNVVILILDCFRYDYLEHAAPRLRAFGEKAWWFERFYVAAPWTKPSTASLFTGLYVRKHFVMKGGGSQLPQEALTLAELMQQQGFTTAGFVWNPHLTRRQAFDQGFDYYADDPRPGSKSLLYEFFSWIEQERPARFFAYVHFQGTHDPYYVDNDLLSLLSAPGYSGDLDFSTVDYKFAVNADGRRLSPQEVAHLKHVAEGKARRVDREAVGGFLKRFEASALPRNTLLVITADHGDSFFEHGSVSHGTLRPGDPRSADAWLPLAVREPALPARLWPEILSGLHRRRSAHRAGFRRCPGPATGRWHLSGSAKRGRRRLL